MSFRVTMDGMMIHPPNNKLTKQMRLITRYTIETAFLCLGMLTACSDETLRDEPRPVSIEQAFNADGEAYMLFRLQTPAEGHTRAATPQDGDEAEYAVNLSHSYLILFSGANENSAVARSVYRLDRAFTKERDPNITSGASFVTPIVRNNIGDTDKLYAFVLLNAPEQLFHFTAGASAAGNTLRFGPDTYIVGNTDAGGSGNISISDFLRLKAGFDPSVNTLPRLKPGGNGETEHPFADFYGMNYLLMTNAVLSTVKGGNLESAPSVSNSSTQVLAPIALDRLHGKASDAASGEPAATIYVERAVAKVNVSKTGSTAIGKDDNNAAFTYDITGWTLLNATRTAYLTKHIDNGDSSPQGTFTTYARYASSGATDNYRFLGTSPLGTGTPLYLINWAVSPHYRADYNAANYLNTTVPDRATWHSSLNDADYPMENTTDVDHMRQRATTAVELEVTLGSSKNGQEIRDYGVLTSSELPDEVFTVQGLNNLVTKKLLADQNLKLLADLFAKDATYQYPAGYSVTQAQLTAWRANWLTLFRSLLRQPTAQQFYDANTDRFRTSFPAEDRTVHFADLYRMNGSTPLLATKPNPVGTATGDFGAAFAAAASHFKSDAELTSVTGLEGLVRVKGQPVTWTNNPDGTAATHTEVAQVLHDFLAAALSWLAYNYTSRFGFYRGGKMYYVVPLRHFDDSETPWHAGETPTPSQVAYPKSDAEASGATVATQGENYLGRYGLVRNNWYELQIAGVDKPGATEPQPFDTDREDDSMVTYLRFYIKILPWRVKSDQNIDFTHIDAN